MDNVSEDIFSLVRPEAYRNAGRTNLFPTAASLNWFKRKHRQQLVKEKAIVSPTGRELLNPPIFDKYIANLTAVGVEK